jgi:hypothetical protein
VDRRIDVVEIDHAELVLGVLDLARNLCALRDETGNDVESRPLSTALIYVSVLVESGDVKGRASPIGVYCVGHRRSHHFGIP